MSGIFLFHRDFRIYDNLGLNLLTEKTRDITPLFVYTPEQITTRNKYRSENSIQFMVESLEDLNKQTGKKLVVCFGDLIKVLQAIFIANKNIKYLAFNQDYTPYAKKRTAKVIKLCKKYDIEVIIGEDYTLIGMEDMRGGEYYSVFNPFYQKELKSNIPKPTSKRIRFKNVRISQKLKKNVGYGKKFYTTNDELYQIPGRREGLKILKGIKKFRSYPKTRNIPSINTTLLSAHIKFGTVSIREVYWSMVKGLGKKSDLVRQIVWHDFYAQLMNYLPVKKTLGGGNFKNKVVKWNKNKKLLDKWKEGKTGYPIVDAGMRQLRESGWMHNRVRLITANFLTIILGINWREGERWFAQNLVDYDVSSNNGNWQWTAQVGTDRVPYLRVYNPFKQAKDIDPECEYIKRWIPELEDVDDKVILNWEKEWENYKDIDYPRPIVDFSISFKKGKKRFGRKI